jgi:NADPH-dependent 2,4-dienoyl-CoA reductase/sulfur reductase-like enzyme
MVFAEIRRRVGDDFLVGFRYTIDESDPDGLDFDACVAIAKIFEAEGHIDFFNAIYGRMDTEIGLAVDNMPGMASPIAPWLEPVGRFKREIALPVFHAARITDIATARHAIAEGLLDMVAMTRAQIADPHLVAKLRAGHEERIRPCVGATHCMSPQRPVCLHNAATGRETYLPHAITPAEAPRRVVVIGGGPAGLEAARVAGERGHAVTLLEAAPRLGGQILLAARASWRRDVIGVVEWRIAELERLGVAVRASTMAEAAGVTALDPDVVIVATGGIPDLDWLDGAEHATSAWDLLGGHAPLGAEIIIYDGTGRHPAPQCAEMAAAGGAKVSLFSIDGHLAAELTYSERVIWKKRGYELGLETRFDERLVGIEKSGNRLTALFVNEVTGSRSTRTADQIVVEHGTLPADGLYLDLRGLSANDGVTDVDALVAGAPQPPGPNTEASFALHRIGDAVASRNIPAAVLDALRLMRVV